MKRFLRRLRKTPMALVSAIVLLLMLIMGLFLAPFFKDSANNMNLALRLQKPFQGAGGWQYWLGSDSLGRPMISQIIYGSRASLTVALAVVAFSLIIGSALGIASGYLGGVLDAMVMRVSDVIVTLPSVLIALAVLFVLKPSLINLILVLTLTRLPVYMRTSRAQTLAIKEQVFIESSRAVGKKRLQIMIKDISPLVAPTLLTVGMLEIAQVILAAAGLSFLGVGLIRPQIDWGGLISGGKSYLETAWWISTFPGIAMILVAVSANILSNWFRAVSDPQLNSLLLMKRNLAEDGDNLDD